MSWRVILPVIAISAACLYSIFKNKEGQTDEDVKLNIFQAWDSTIKLPEKKFSRISIGINANVDLIVPGVKVMEALGLTPGKSNDLQVLNTPEELQEAFSYYMARGAAVERAYADSKSYKAVVDTAADLRNASWYIGGNAALMAQNIVTRFHDTDVELVGPVGPRLQQLLHRTIHIPLSSVVPDDEVHLILEYGVGEQWGDHRAPVATRFITSYDEANGRASSLETFFSRITTYNPELVVCTGLHLLEGQSEQVWDERIPVLLHGLQSLPQTLPVHMELASMVNARFVSTLLTKTLFQVTSLGLNEQELSFLSQTLGGPHQDMLAKGQPEIHKVTDIMIWILQHFGKSSENTASKLTRIHFHSLTFHIIGVVSGHWSNIEAAVSAGANVAGQQACDSIGKTPDGFDLKIPRKFKLFSDEEESLFDSSNPVRFWEVGNCQFAFSPVLVCKAPSKTVGLGDAISAVGLLYSDYLTL